MSADMVCLQFRALERNTLRGFVDLQWGGIIFKDCALHERDLKRWVAPPARPTLDKDHALMRDTATGKLKYVPLLEFATPADRQRFVREALAAIDAYQSKTPAEASVVNGGTPGGGQPQESSPW